ncbi:hypothetical protein BGZ46_005113 [Entomortierella lignicola]|nr:hypothetical protein BGZ46_005113 [Entomortierella lignicola]
MEHSVHRRPLLISTNALLDTTDLYHTLTLPLLRVANRTKLISTRCSTTSLAPHLLTFVSNDLYDYHSSSVNLTESKITEYTSKTTITTTSNTVRKPSQYLFALVVQDSSVILPDLLSRILEAIAVLGPDNCHLSIVNHGSTDETGTMLGILSRFLDLYNKGDVQSLYNIQSPKADDEGGDDSTTTTTTKRKLHQLSYTITTLKAKDNSPQNLSKIRNMALNPYFDINAVSDATQDKNKKMESNESEETNKNIGSHFDNVVMLDPVIICAEDMLELIFQSQLQDADLTCGMDLKYTTELSESFRTSGKPQEGAYDSTITRDMLGQKLHKDNQGQGVFSTDPKTQTRFLKRLPFQVESCWSGAVVLRSSALSFSSFHQPQIHLSTENQSQQYLENQQCVVDDRAAFCESLWENHEEIQSHELSPTKPVLGSSSSSIPRMMVVPSIGISRSPKDYASLGRFNAWGLWPKTEKKYRDELDTQLEAASHPTYGYKSSTSSYGYIARVEEDESQILTLEDVEQLDKTDKKKVERKIDEGLSLLMIPEDMTSALKSRLEEIMSVFGVQDIQNAVLAKLETELIDEWRDLSRLQAREC